MNGLTVVPILYIRRKKYVLALSIPLSASIRILRNGGSLSKILPIKVINNMLL